MGCTRSARETTTEEMMTEIKWMAGTVYVPFRENADIAIQNFLNGRPLYDGFLPSRVIPPRPPVETP